MLVAILLVHQRFGVFMNWSGKQQGEGFEYHLLALALCVLMMWKGAVAVSLDRAVGRVNKPAKYGWRL